MARSPGVTGVSRITLQKPLYYRFVVNPNSGHVTLAHNHEGHPADNTSHGQLAIDLREPDLIHGYAYRLDGGWRLHNYENKPFTDPWVMRQVSQKLAEEDGEPPKAPANEPKTSFKRFHYGKPLPN